MANTRITELPEVDSAQLQNDAGGNLRAQTTFIPCSEGGVTKKIKLSDLSSYRSPGTVKEIYSGADMAVTTNVQSGISFPSFTLPGAIFVYPGLALPDGYLYCNGSAVSRATYNNLFLAIGTLYGAGDNRSSFNLPDLRGRCVVGNETMGSADPSGRLTNTRPGNINGTILGSSGGSDIHTLQNQETGLKLHNHTHSLSISWGGGAENGNRCDGGDGGVAGTFPGGAISNNSFTLSWQYGFNSDATSDLSALPHTNLPPLVFLNYIIKY